MSKYKDIISITKNLNVLCVDDEDDSNEQLKDLLLLFFNNIYTASNGMEALDIYSDNQKNIDIIFTDISMPDMDGIALTENIKSINPLQYIVTLSAHQDLQYYNKAINAGVNGMIIKPLTADKLINNISKALRQIAYINKLKQQTNQIQPSEQSDLKVIDSITKLPNKTKLDSYLNTNTQYTAILVNIDNFDNINCTYGYHTGDQVLIEIANFLKSFVKNNEYRLFRVVSDEFVFLISNKQENKEIELFSKEVISSLESITINTDLDQFQLSCTIGISKGVGEDIIKQAHIAIKEAREIGKHKYYFYSNNSQIIQKRQNNLKWLSKIKKALKEDCLTPYYQTIIDNKNNKPVMYESLARVREMNRVVKPYYFIENAKLFKLMPNLGKTIIKKVFKYCANTEYKISINITDQDLNDENFTNSVLENTLKYSINPKNIIFEILENIITDKNKTIIKNIQKLKKNNFQIALDDFGTKEIIISNLHSIPIDYIKIDPSFIETIVENKKSQKVVKSIIKLANDLEAKTIAESVSSEAILKKVKELGVDYSQGFFIQQPKEFIEQSH